MKVVVQNTGRVWGGNEKWLATVAAGLSARGDQVVVSCRAGGAVAGELARRGMPAVPVRPGAVGDAARGLRFASWLRRTRPDALLLTSWNSIPWGALAGRWAGVPRIVVRLGIVRPLPRRGPHAWAFRRAVDALVVNAEEIRAECLRSAPWLPAERVHVVLNAAAAPPPGGRAALRAELGLRDGVLAVAGVGHLQRRKGFDLLLDAFARAGIPDAQVVIVGAGPELEPLRARAAALGIADRVRWTGPRADAARLLGACDLFVLSSRNEGMANALLEAMAARVPVVCADVPGVRTAVGAREGRPAAGRIVPPDDAGALAAALAEAAAGVRAGSDEVRARVDEAAWRIGNWFTVERMVDETRAVLRGAA